MKDYVIFTDTDTDITPEVASRYGYHLISMPYVIDGVEIFPYVGNYTFNEHEFYDSLRKGTLPKTCGIDVIKYKNYFEPFLKEGKDILYVHFSAAMTGTFNAMKIAIEELKEQYPNNSIYTIDTKGITIISYAIACDIGDLYLQGKSIQEIIDWANVEVDHYSQYFYANTLKFFAKSGRVTGIAAVMGDIIGIKPIIYMTQDGKMENIDKARGRKNAEQLLLNYVDELGDDVVNHRVIIGHTDALDFAKELEAKLQEKFDNKLNIEFVCTNPTAGSHCGPDGVGVCFHSKHR